MSDNSDDTEPPENQQPGKVATDLREDERGAGPIARESLSPERKALLHKVVIAALAFRAELSAETKARGLFDQKDGEPDPAEAEALDSAVESVGLASRTLERAILDTAEVLTKAPKESEDSDGRVRSLVAGFADEMMRFRPTQVEKGEGEVIDLASWRKDREKD